MNFETIDYLNKGTPRQRAAYRVLTGNRILEKLEPFSPLLVGTIPINIDIETSDLDIICYWTDQQFFHDALVTNFKHEQAFSIRQSSTSDREAVIATFRINDFELEIFGQNLPTRQQLGYRHMLIEHGLLTERGETFRQAIIALKRQGYKTEPAFGKLLGLGPDPYVALLTYENSWPPND